MLSHMESSNFKLLSIKDAFLSFNTDILSLV